MAATPSPSIVSGLGAVLTLAGASVTSNATIVLPSGTLTLHATGPGDVTLTGGRLDASGLASTFFDETKYSGGGAINLVADNGNVMMMPGSVVTVSATGRAGNAGTLSISAPLGTVTAQGSLLGQAGAGGTGGTFELDANGLAPNGQGQQTTAALDSLLNAGGFTQSRA